MTSPTPPAAGPKGSSTCAESAQVQTSPAAVPTEEDVARLIYEAHGFAFEGRTILADGTPYAAWAKAVTAARAILALFAPVLAEKERQLNTLAEDWDAHGAELTALYFKEREGRLAAEAALASARDEERERCLAIVNAQVPEWVKQRSGPYWDGYREAMEDAADDICKGAATIRSQA